MNKQNKKNFPASASSRSLEGRTKVGWWSLLFPVLFLFCTFFIFPSSADAAILSKPPNNLGLVGYWSFNENSGSLAGDSSGQGNSGTLTPGASGSNTTAAQMWEPAGKFGSGLDIDGTDDYVNVGNNTPLNFGTGSFTASAWVKTTDTGNYKTIINKGSSNAGATDRYYMRIEASTGKFHASIADGTNEANIGGVRTGLHDGAWHHVAMVVDRSGTTMYTYVDGVQDSSTSISSIGNIDSSSGFKMGILESQYYYKGTLDDVRVYGRALTAAQVAALYGSGSVIRKGVSERSLVGHWTMDEGRGAVAGDSSGNGYTGTFNSVPSWSNGRRGGALTFDGTDDYADLGSATTNYTQSYTYSVWAKPDRFGHPSSNCGDKRTYIMSQQVSSSNFVEFRALDGDYFSFRHIATPSNADINSASGLATGVWYHLVGTYDSSANEFKFYLNNSLVSTVDTTGKTMTNPSAGTLRLGYNAHNCSNAYFKGSVDDARLYSRALSALEISNLYSSGAQKINSSQNNRMTSGLINLWSFNGPDISNGVLLDRAGSVNGTPRLIATSTFYTAGKVGQGLEFNGTNKVDLASSITLSHTSNWTVSMWVKTSYGAADQFLLTNQSGGPVSNAMRIVSSGKMNYYHYNGVWNSHSGNITVNDGDWHHLTWANSSNATVSMYVDGVLDVTVASDNSGPLNRIGNVWDSGSSGLIGTMDEVRFYNRTLTAAEVKQLYLMGR